ncbi:MAG: hypothetical protein KGL39_52760 [Patescibacteria group bacterium]|nr:hypothetical protein [Patescibacteria group bacterium]
MKYSEKITHESAPSNSTPCWSVYIAAVMANGGIYTEGHSYGKTRDEAVSGASHRLAEKVESGVGSATITHYAR